MSVSQKTKLLYIKQILERYTDANHDLTQAQIQEKLEKNGYAPKARTLHDDLEALYECQQDFDIKLENNVKLGKDKAHTLRYKITERLFTPTEVKLLMESVRGLKSLSSEQTEILIEKLSSLCSDAEARDIKKHFAVVGGFKAFWNKGRDYDLTLKAIETIDKAIDLDAKIRFRYFWYSIDHKPKFPKDNAFRHTVTPLVRVFENGYCYLIAIDNDRFERIKKTIAERYSSPHFHIDKILEYDDALRHYRLDRMTNIEILNEKRNIPEKSRCLSLNWKEYVNSSFGLGFTTFVDHELAVVSSSRGHDYIPPATNDLFTVTIKFTRDLVGIVMDRFGRDVLLQGAGNRHFIATFQAYKNDQFLTWLIGLKKKVQIIYPESLRKDLSRFARETGMWHHYSKRVVQGEYRVWMTRKPYWTKGSEDTSEIELD